MDDDGMGQYTRPAHPDHTMLDVRRGDTVIAHGVPELVVGVAAHR